MFHHWPHAKTNRCGLNQIWLTSTVTASCHQTLIQLSLDSVIVLLNPANRRWKKQGARSLSGQIPQTWWTLKVSFEPFHISTLSVHFTCNWLIDYCTVSSLGQPLDKKGKTLQPESQWYSRHSCWYGQWYSGWTHSGGKIPTRPRQRPLQLRGLEQSSRSMMSPRRKWRWAVCGGV